MTAATITGPERAATEAWSKRVRMVGGFIQVAFAAFWLVRGGLILGDTIGSALVVAFCLTAVAVTVYGKRVTKDKAPRSVTAEAKRIERDVTVATILQLVASFVAPVLVALAGHSDWILPSIAITIGPLLLWLDYRVGVPRLRYIGLALIVGPLLLVVVLSGTALAATTGIAAGTLLLGTAAAGFHDLAQMKKTNLKGTGQTVGDSSGGQGSQSLYYLLGSYGGSEPLARL